LNRYNHLVEKEAVKLKERIELDSMKINRLVLAVIKSNI